MNTSIPEPNKRFMTRIGIPLAILVITACILTYASWESIRSAIPVKAVTVVIRSVETDSPQESTLAEGVIIQAPGWVEAEPFSVYAGALTEGIVESILVLEGDTVVKGQAVAKLVSEDSELAVKATSANEKMWKSKLQVAQAQLDELADEYRRKEPLVHSGALAEGPVERLRLRLLTAEASIANTQASLNEAIVAREIAQLSLSRCTVVAPIDGVVMERLTSPGSVIGFGNGEHSSHIVHLYDPTQLQVRADIPLAYASKVEVEHPAKIVVDVLPDIVFSGEVLRFVHRADQQKNTIEAKVKILNPSPLLKPDMLARVKIQQPKQAMGNKRTWTEQHVFVPRAVIHEMTNPVVWVISDLTNGFGKAEQRGLELGKQEFDGWIEVLSGLSTGDKVITSEINFTDGDIVQLDGGH
ncbi:MAG: hypothetical protein CMJ26_02405 [Phycisphaerae bacterium]|jgi:RND family efflux transporter MFP subunit|nr:hypothetical protein [Phycisphaerae bacterium]|tara:strand:- start:3612 stop:4850 length:1239 start_codon:yes stop_codon:yes gene_type:complete